MQFIQSNSLQSLLRQKEAQKSKKKLYKNKHKLETKLAAMK